MLIYCVSETFFYNYWSELIGILFIRSQESKECSCVYQENVNDNIILKSPQTLILLQEMNVSILKKNSLYKLLKLKNRYFLTFY